MRAGALMHGCAGKLVLATRRWLHWSAGLGTERVIQNTIRVVHKLCLLTARSIWSTMLRDLRKTFTNANSTTGFDCPGGQVLESALLRSI
jgi:hypothetical protein